MRSLFLAAWIGLAALSGCSPAHPGRLTEKPGAACPTVKSYSPARQRKVGAELYHCGQNCSAVRRWITDYYVLRAQLRACQG